MGGCLITNLIQAFYEKLPFNPEWLSILALVSLITFIVSLIVIPWIIVRLPSDYFVNENRHNSKIHQQYPVFFFLLKFVRNIIGVMLIIAGIVMLVLPGQGLLTILVGIGFADFPGKFKLLRRLSQQPSVLNSMNWIRHKAGEKAFIRPV